MEQILLKCKNCGEPLDFAKAVDGVILCTVCDYYNTVPKKEVSPAALSFLRQGEHDLDTCKFEDAYSAYEKAAEYDGKEPEAYFGMALAEFKVQYIKDTVNNRIQPVCHGFTNKAFSQNRNYLKALDCATEKQKVEYEKRAQEIDYIRNEFLKLKNSGLSYDCFICVKVSDEEGKKTEDSFKAREVYESLRERGYRPFYSEYEIRSRAGCDYEALILYALYSAKCMLVVCSDESYLRTRWVKNEYTRYLEMISDEEKADDSITILFDKTVIERLPNRKGKLQGIPFSMSAMSRIEEFVQRHTRPNAIEKEKPEPKVEPKVEPKPQPKPQPKSEPKIDEEQRRIVHENYIRIISEHKSEPKPEPKPEPKRATPATPLSSFEIEKGVLKKFIGQETEVVIPDNVTSIGEKAFVCKNLKSVIIPDSVTSIGKYAFMDCSGFTNITIPDSVTSIGNFAFDSCSDLTSVVIGNSVKSIGNSAFSSCEKLSSVVIGNGVKSIGNFAFYSCSGLSSLTIDNGVKSIGNFAFDSCSGLTSVTIPDSVTSIGNFAFQSCSSLIKINYKGTIEQWNDTSKYEDWDLDTGNYTIICTDGAIEKAKPKPKVEPKPAPKPEPKVDPKPQPKPQPKPEPKVEPKPQPKPTIPATPLSSFEIENGVLKKFIGQETEVIIPDYVKSIDYKAFIYKNLKSVIIPDSVTSIDKQAFAFCSELKSVSIGNGVTSIGSSAFCLCGGLTSVVVDENNPVYYSENNCVIEKGSKTLIFGCNNSVIPDGVKSIGDWAFAHCRGLTGVIIPSSVTSIGEIAFGGCRGLTSITIPDSVTSIGEAAFAFCSELKSITIPSSVTNICHSTFSSCEKLTRIVVDKNNPAYYSENNCLIEKYSNALISGCKNSIIPDGVTSIGHSAFDDCSGLTSINIPASVKEIGEKAFDGCSELTSINIPANVTSIGGYAFYSCYSLTSVTIGNGVTSIGGYAFQNCSSLRNINYNGTIEQWKKISKGKDWDKNTANYTVCCTDGDIKK